MNSNALCTTARAATVVWAVLLLSGLVVGRSPGAQDSALSEEDQAVIMDFFKAGGICLFGREAASAKTHRLNEGAEGLLILALGPRPLPEIELPDELPAGVMRGGGVAGLSLDDARTLVNLGVATEESWNEFIDLFAVGIENEELQASLLSPQRAERGQTVLLEALTGEELRDLEMNKPGGS